MMMFDLPEDLVEEILSKIPATTFIRLRSTCNQWNDLFNDKKFIQKHRSKTSKQNMVVLLKDIRVYSMVVNLHGIGNNFAGSSIMVSRKPSLVDSPYNSEIDISGIFHCDGLLLCTTKDNNRLVVWNPCTGQTKWIEPRNEYDHKCDRLYDNYVFGYENNSSFRDYKILKVSFCDHIFQFEIYEFNSNSWRILDFTPYFDLWSRGESLKGNAYLIGKKKGPNKVLISFNFTTERFGCLCLLVQNDYEEMDLSVVKDEQLSLLCYNLAPLQIEIWMTNEIKPNFVSWSKFFTSGMINLYSSRKFSGHMNFLIDKEKKVVMFRSQVIKEGNWKDIVHIVGEDAYKEEDLGESSTSWPIMSTYVPSLAQI